MKNMRGLEKRYLRQKRLHVIREAHRLSRLHVTYNPNKPVEIKHELRVNQNYTIHDPVRGKRIITLPNALNFRDEANVTLDTLKSIREEILHGSSSEVFLEQRQLQEISPEAAVVLLAEIVRCLTYASRKKSVRSNYPQDANVAKMLTDIGFYKFLNIKAPSSEIRKGSRTYFSIVSGNRTDGRIINSLIATFERVVRLGPIAKKRLYAALTECMDNVRAHAYVEESSRPDLLGEWWMAGFCDLSTAQVALVFFDQGVGIPTTLKTKISVKIKSALRWDDSELIREAVESGLSREKSERHGNGLPSLKDFINELSPGGFLRVLSNHGDYTYCKNNNTRYKDLRIPLEGSLIVWSIQPDVETIGADGIIDLSIEKQLRLSL